MRANVIDTAVSTIRTLNARMRDARERGDAFTYESARDERDACQGALMAFLGHRRNPSPTPGCPQSQTRI